MTNQPQHDLTPHPDRPETWPSFNPLIIAHDVGHTRDRSTAVVGGGSPYQTGVTGILETRELPQGLYGSARASALAAVDRKYHNNTLIVADLTNEASYGEFLHQTFGPRVIGLQITRYGNGMEMERRPVGNGVMPVYTLGRSQMIDHFHSLMATNMVRLIKGPESQRAFEQFHNLQLEMRDTGKVYSCLPGHHDDLAISYCMLAWAAGHPHASSWYNRGFANRRPSPPAQNFGWGAFT